MIALYIAVVTVSVYQPLIMIVTTTVIRRIILVLVQRNQTKAHSSPQFYTLYLTWSLLLGITGTRQLVFVLCLSALSLECDGDQDDSIW